MEWEKETSTDHLIWLHRMAKGILKPPKEMPPLIIIGGQLGRAGDVLEYLSENIPSYTARRISVDLNDVRVRSDDFYIWCKSAGHPLPHFWFGAQNQSETTDLPKRKPSLETRLSNTVRRLFWENPVPPGYNRPTKDQIIDWLMDYASQNGLTNKAAARIYTATRPEHIPSRGNLPRDKKPFPLPPHPK